MCVAHSALHGAPSQPCTFKGPWPATRLLTSCSVLLRERYRAIALSSCVPYCVIQIDCLPHLFEGPKLVTILELTLLNHCIQRFFLLCMQLVYPVKYSSRQAGKVASAYHEAWQVELDSTVPQGGGTGPTLRSCSLTSTMSCDLSPILQYTVDLHNK